MHAWGALQAWGACSARQRRCAGRASAPCPRTRAAPQAAAVFEAKKLRHAFSDDQLKASAGCLGLFPCFAGPGLPPGPCPAIHGSAAQPCADRQNRQPPARPCPAPHPSAGPAGCRLRAAARKPRAPGAVAAARPGSAQPHRRPRWAARCRCLWPRGLLLSSAAGRCAALPPGAARTQRRSVCRLPFVVDAAAPPQPHTSTISCGMQRCSRRRRCAAGASAPTTRGGCCARVRPARRPCCCFGGCAEGVG